MKEEKRRTMDKRSSPSSPLFQIENLTMIRLDENDLKSKFRALILFFRQVFFV